MIEQNSRNSNNLLIFTDLDGTLLDHENYSFEPALPALEALKEKDIPLIICTSKTRAEIEEIRNQLNNTHPFIAENGGAIFIPKGYFSHPISYTKEDENYYTIELGIPYEKLRGILKRMSASISGRVKGFGDLSLKEVADICGFSLHQAKLAKRREYDEAFLLQDEEDEEFIQEIADRSNLKITKGGRFYHLIGNNDKGKAVLMLKNIYEEEIKNLKTIAIGDSQNDLPMLKAVDYPVLVQKPDGSYDPSVKLDNLILAPGTGPSGWCQAVLNLIKNL